VPIAFGQGCPVISADLLSLAAVVCNHGADEPLARTEENVRPHWKNVLARLHAVALPWWWLLLHTCPLNALKDIIPLLVCLSVCLAAWLTNWLSVSSVSSVLLTLSLFLVSCSLSFPMRIPFYLHLELILVLAVTKPTQL